MPYCGINKILFYQIDISFMQEEEPQAIGQEHYSPLLREVLQKHDFELTTEQAMSVLQECSTMIDK